MRIPPTVGMVGFDGGSKRAVRMAIPRRRVDEEETAVIPAATPSDCAVLYRGRNSSSGKTKTCGFAAFDESPNWYRQKEFSESGSYTSTPTDPNCCTITQTTEAGWTMWVEFPSCLALGCIALSGSYIFDRDCPLAPENNVHTTIDATCDTALGSMAGIGEPTDTQTTQTYSNTLSEMTEACGGTTLSGSYSATYTLSEPILTSELVDALIVAAPGRGGSVDDEATEAVYWLFSDESGGLYKALSYWFEPDPTNPITTDHVTIGWEVAVYEADPSGAPGAELSRVSHSATDPWLTTYDIEPGVGVGPSFYRRHRIENITLFCYDDP